MNAAVSLTMCAFGRLAWKMLPLYVFAQLLGSFLAAGTIYAVYYGEGKLHVQAHKALNTFIVTESHCCISVGIHASESIFLVNIFSICRSHI